MTAISCMIFALIAVNLVTDATIHASEEVNVVSVRTATGSQAARSMHFKPLARRYDINDLGYNERFHGWVDVQGQGAAHDYCRMVGNTPNIFLSCALAGTHGDSDNNYISATVGFDCGYPNTWYMKDEDGDGRDDYCRCTVKGEQQMVVCTKAGPKGFYGSAEQGGNMFTFTPTGPIDCQNRQVRPEFGRVSGFVI